MKSDDASALSRHPPASVLPPQATQDRKRGAEKGATAKRSATHLANHTVREWNEWLGRCPETSRPAIMTWLRAHYGVNGAQANAIVSASQVLSRNMPNDFVEAVFGHPSSPSRTVLDKIVAELRQSLATELIPVEGGVALSCTRTIAIVRPVIEGVLLMADRTVASGGKFQHTSQLLRINESAESIAQAAEVIRAEARQETGRN